jgi:hypothetical protein
MGAMDARRLELYELLKPKLDEEPARALVLALPADPEQLATKDDLSAMESRLDAKLDARFAQMDSRFAQMEATLTRRMVTIMGSWTMLVGTAFAWAALLLR